MVFPFLFLLLLLQLPSHHAFTIGTTAPRRTVLRSSKSADMTVEEGTKLVVQGIKDVEGIPEEMVRTNQRTMVTNDGNEPWYNEPWF